MRDNTNFLAIFFFFLKFFTPPHSNTTGTYISYYLLNIIFQESPLWLGGGDSGERESYSCEDWKASRRPSQAFCSFVLFATQSTPMVQGFCAHSCSVGWPNLTILATSLTESLTWPARLTSAAGLSRKPLKTKAPKCTSLHERSEFRLIYQHRISSCLLLCVHSLVNGLFSNFPFDILLICTVPVPNYQFFFKMIVSFNLKGQFLLHNNIF